MNRAINNVPNTVHTITRAAGRGVNFFNKIGIIRAKTATFGYLIAKFPKVAPKIAELAYLVRPEAINSGKIANTPAPTITAEVVPIKLVMMEPQIAMVETTSAWIVPGVESVTSNARAAQGTRILPIFPDRKLK